MFSKDPKEGESADTNNVLSCHLKEAEVDVTVPSFLGWMIDGTCEALVFENFQTKFCAGKSGVDSCQGDSGCQEATSTPSHVYVFYSFTGGPLFVTADTDTDQVSFTQIGIVSYGYGCASRYPGVYTRVDRLVRHDVCPRRIIIILYYRFTKWIREILMSINFT